ncbi:MAG: hypothetical protein J1E65_09590 [Lachnospiraceae bacterium]|nr:hypothetical protein [Lachnospiraceae bacterium]
MIFKRKKYHMNVEQADATLQKVFAACEQSPNSTSFDKLLLRRQLNTRILDNMLLLTTIILVLTFLSPLVIASVNELFPEEIIYRETVTNTYIFSEDAPVYAVADPQ